MKFKDGDRVIAIKDSCWQDTGILGTVALRTNGYSGPYPYIVTWDEHYSRKRDPHLVSHGYAEYQIALVHSPLNKVHYRLSLDLHLPPTIPC